MESIFEKKGNDILIDRINALTPNSKPTWGKMSVNQMLKHCNAAIEVAFGEKEIKVNFLIQFFGKMLKNKVFKSDFGQNSPTAKEFIFKGEYDFESSKQNLIMQVQRFHLEGMACIASMEHPFWGKLSYDDWNTLMWKHLDHHLKQFGV